MRESSMRGSMGSVFGKIPAGPENKFTAMGMLCPHGNMPAECQLCREGKGLIVDKPVDKLSGKEWEKGTHNLPEYAGDGNETRNPADFTDPDKAPLNEQI